MTYHVKELLLPDGKSPYADWFGTLDAMVAVAKDGLKIIVLLGGGSKKRQQKDIDQAVVLWEDYKRRKAQILKGM